MGKTPTQDDLRNLETVFRRESALYTVKHRIHQRKQSPSQPPVATKVVEPPSQSSTSNGGGAVPTDLSEAPELRRWLKNKIKTLLRSEVAYHRMFDEDRPEVFDEDGEVLISNSMIVKLLFEELRQLKEKRDKARDASDEVFLGSPLSSSVSSPTPSVGDFRSPPPALGRLFESSHSTPNASVGQAPAAAEQQSPADVEDLYLPKAVQRALGTEVLRSKKDVSIGTESDIEEIVVRSRERSRPETSPEVDSPLPSRDVVSMPSKPVVYDIHRAELQPSALETEYRRIEVLLAMRDEGLSMLGNDRDICVAKHHIDLSEVLAALPSAPAAVLQSPPRSPASDGFSLFARVGTGADVQEGATSLDAVSLPPSDEES